MYFFNAEADKKAETVYNLKECQIELNTTLTTVAAGGEEFFFY